MDLCVAQPPCEGESIALRGMGHTLTLLPLRKLQRNLVNGNITLSFYTTWLAMNGRLVWKSQGAGKARLMLLGGGSLPPESVLNQCLGTGRGHLLN